MNSVTAIKARLLEAGTPFSFVRGAASLANVAKGQRPAGVLPVAYVVSAFERTAADERATGPVYQRQERDVVVVIVAEDLSDPEGDAVGDVLEDLKDFVRGRLIGFTPEGMHEPITHAAGEMTEAENGCVWFEDTFSAPTYLGEQA